MSAASIPPRRAPIRTILLVLLGTALPATAQELPPPQEAPVDLTRSEWLGLRWLEGTWRGRGGSYDAFFEDFHWRDDSTVARRTFADSTLAVVTDSSELVLRAGRLHSLRQGVHRGSAVLLRGDSLRFSTGVLWVRRSNDRWTAVVGGGRVVYEMERHARERGP